MQRNQHRLQGTLEFNSSEWANQTIKAGVYLNLDDEAEMVSACVSNLDPFRAEELRFVLQLHPDL